LGSESFNVGILGTGSCFPEKILTNSDLEAMVDTTNEWILKRTGIRERRILDDSQPAYEMGLEAAKKALEDSSLEASQIDLILVSTNSPDYLSPSTAAIIQGKLGASNASAFDINAACSGFVYAAVTAEQFIKSGYYKYVLVISVEALSKITDWKHRNTCVLFGDAAAAAVFGKVSDDTGLQSSWLGTDGTMSDVITVPCCFSSNEDRAQRVNGKEHVIRMDGSEVFKFAVRIMTEASLLVVEKASLTMDDVALIIPHQANLRIIEGAAKRLGISEDKVFSANIRKYGNTSSSSIPLALDELSRSNSIIKGDNIVLVGFGGGLTWSAALIKWSI